MKHTLFYYRWVILLTQRYPCWLRCPWSLLSLTNAADSPRIHATRICHKSEQYLTNPRPRLLYQSWGSNTSHSCLQWFSCPPGKLLCNIHPWSKYPAARQIWYWRIWCISPCWQRTRKDLWRGQNIWSWVRGRAQKARTLNRSTDPPNPNSTISESIPHRHQEQSLHIRNSHDDPYHNLCQHSHYQLPASP